MRGEYQTSHARVMTPYFPLEMLRKAPGMENARYEDPYAGGLGNSMRYMGMAPRNDALQVEGVDNLFSAGEKAGLQHESRSRVENAGLLEVMHR